MSDITRSVVLDSWTKFPETIAKIRNEFGTRVVPDVNGGSREVSNDIVFRGSPNSEWPLTTTLERASSETYSISRYLQRADSIVNEIESITGKLWELDDFDVVKKEIVERQDSFRIHLPVKYYEFLVYLRHHGFPSPLLDWTRSPYVAAYFAFESPIVADSCSVYAFIESPEGCKSMNEGLATISTLGPHVTTHFRHFSQKASYTVATRWDDASSSHFFCPHESVMPDSINVQDVLIKITIPRSDRVAALKQLEDYNINHFTLFQSEDSLVRSLSIRAFELE